MTRKPRVLFLCTANSCRSQMAEGWLRHLARGRVEALSAGIHPTELNPLAVEVMAERGVDLRSHTCDPIEAQLEDPPDLVIAVCSAAAASCPALPGQTPLLLWPFEEPSGARGGEQGLRAALTEMREALRERIQAWIEAGFPGLPRRRTAEPRE